MWKSRSPPIPLDYEGIMHDSFVLRPNGVPAVNGQANGAAPPKLKDQRALSLKDNVVLFIDRCGVKPIWQLAMLTFHSSTNRLAARLQNGEDTISFDKDDDDTLDFVTAASNLRSSAYGIETKTRWEVKEMAGNIIPAIATTNAIVSGLIVLQALHLLRKSHLVTLGTMHSLPSPVQRRSQKVYKPEFFETLKKEKDARDGVRLARDWIVDEDMKQVRVPSLV